MNARGTLAAAVAVLAMIGSVLMGGAGATASAAAATKTKIVLLVHNCAGCQVGLQQAFSGGSYWDGPSEPVVNGRVVFLIPKQRTRGLSITVVPDWDNSGARPNVIFRYAGVAVGKKVGPKMAARKKRASGCWAGTTRSQVRMRIRVAAYGTTGYDGQHGYAARVWASETRRALQPYGRTYRGSLGNQDALLCKR